MGDPSGIAISPERGLCGDGQQDGTHGTNYQSALAAA